MIASWKDIKGFIISPGAVYDISELQRMEKNTK